MNDRSCGRLRVVATPLGNLEDLSPRARAALETADAIAAEDTRRTGKLLELLGLPKRPLLSYFAPAYCLNQRHKVSGVTREPSSFKVQRERACAFNARQRRCSSVNRRRLPPSISRSTLISSFWYAMTVCWCRLTQPASININNCPGEHHDFDFMRTILARMTIENGAAERPQSADIPQNIRRSSFGTLRAWPSRLL